MSFDFVLRKCVDVPSWHNDLTCSLNGFGLTSNRVILAIFHQQTIYYQISLIHFCCPLGSPKRFHKPFTSSYSCCTFKKPCLSIFNMSNSVAYAAKSGIKIGSSISDGTLIPASSFFSISSSPGFPHPEASVRKSSWKSVKIGLTTTL